MNKNYCVYIHTNKINQKKYVGMTSLKPENRWKSGYGYHNQNAFYADILYYGWGNFEHEIVYQNLTKKEAQLKEVELIQKYKTQNTNYGYNKNKAEYDENGEAIKKYNYKPVEKDYLVYCIELEQAYKNSSVASRATGVDASSILRACKGERHSAGKHPVTGEKLHWKFINIDIKGE